MEKSSAEDNAQLHMKRVITMVDSGLNENGTMLHHKADEEEYCDKFEEVPNDKYFCWLILQHQCMMMMIKNTSTTKTQSMTKSKSYSVM